MQNQPLPASANRTAQPMPQRGMGRRESLLLAGSALLGLAGCASAGSSGRTDTIVPVRNFKLEKYLGKWHEIARIDHRFQKGLVQSSANYSMNADGSVKVINRGFDPEAKKWKEVEGKAKFVGSPDVGALKVSFFGPFYSGYNVVEIDPDYRVAMVIGESTDFFWILAREPQLPPETLKQLLDRAQALGVDLARVRKG